jgi:hypothetical protein
MRQQMSVCHPIRDYKARVKLEAEASGENELRQIAARVKAIPKPRKK